MFDDFNGPAGSAPNPALWTATEGGREGGSVHTSRPINGALDGNGNLALILRKEHLQTWDYTGAQYHTHGKYEFQFGTVEIRAKIPRGTGVHCSLFLLGVNAPQVGGAGKSGEIDIMETYGPNAGTSIYAPGQSSRFCDPGDDWHIYQLRWQRDRIETLIDGHSMKVWTPSTWQRMRNNWLPNKRKFFLLFDITCAAWQLPDASTKLPAVMLIDYARHTA
jgi:beta-glucanase (GH16 family)